MPSVCFYFQVHQPYRIKHYRVFDIGHDSAYFNDNSENDLNNRRILEKVARKSYLPANRTILELIKKHFQEEWKKYPQSIKEKLKEDIAIAFTYNSNAIEGSTITLEEAREIIHDKISPNKPLRDVKETEAHAKVFLEMLEKKEKITNNLILMWHKEIFGQTKSDISGIYRDYLVKVGDYLAPDWQDVKSLMNDLINHINDKKNQKINPVELSARAHYRFEKIHPFGDGNGRIGRLIMNYILWHKNYPMLIIEYKKRKSYYKVLKKSEDEFVKYFIRRYVAVHKKRLK